MTAIAQSLSTLSGLLWGWPLVLTLFGVHLFLTVRLGFIQRYLPLAIRLSFSRKREGAGDVSQFGALMTALAATIGTGNIVGVATAVAAGGPGAVLWMWLTGVFGISTKYAEALLSVKYRILTPQGTMAGGPMYVLEKGLKSKPLGVLFAAFTAVAAFGIGNMVQANSLAGQLQQGAGVAPWVSGLLMALLTALVVLGGIKSIARACEWLVPFMAIFYVLGCLALLAFAAGDLWPALKLIFTSAFSGHEAILGGFAGAGMKEAVRYGVARGLFSNESGLGSAPIVAAAAQTRNPVRQALVSSTGTFWDTVVVCALTGLVVVAYGDWKGGFKGVELTRRAFAHIPQIGPAILTVGLATFVFSTILGWSYYGEKAMEYLFGPRVIIGYRVAWVVFVFIGATVPLHAVWDFADIANALMALPNLLALLLLSGVVARETRKYLKEQSLDSE
ncbi:MAG: sodium:alanine symporter family protein [Spirochaetes bacterium]|nr:sodium:alanine symporter family protein [Spirochaetota bacterium]